MTSPSDHVPAFAVTIETSEAHPVPVVVKRAVDERSAALLDHERDVLRAVNHPDVVELADPLPSRGDDGPEPALFTYLAGTATLATSPPRNASDRARIGSNVARIVGELHDLGWAHGALDARHVVVGSDGRLTLCSLRRARQVHSSESPAAQADVVALRSLIGALAATDATRRTSRRLTELLSRSDALTAAELADVLARFAGDRPVPVRRPQPATAPQAPETTGGAAALVRAVLCVGALVALLAGGVLTASGPAALALRLLGVVATAASAYGAVVNGADAWLARRNIPWLREAINRVAPNRVRRWVLWVSGFGVLGSAVNLAGSSPAPAVRPASVEQAVDLSDASTSTTSSTTLVPTTAPTTTAVPTTTAAPTTTAEPTTTTTLTPTAAPTTTTAAPTTESTTAIAAPAAQPAVTAATVPDTELIPAIAIEAPPAATPLMASEASPDQWVVRRGQHLWGIATWVVAAHIGHHPTETQIEQYCTRLIDANRDRLSDPDNPDLIFAGQVLHLPAVDLPTTN